MDAITHKDSPEPAREPGHDASRELAQALARRLRELRATRGWSLQQAADACGVSKAMLGQIERAESSPTVALLWRIAGGFGCPLSELLPALAPAGAAALPEVRSAARMRARPASDAMLVSPLFRFDPGLGFELLELTLLPGYQRLSEPHARGVVEHVLVLHGRLELLCEGVWRELGEGEGLRLAGDREHGYRNPGEQPVVLLDLIHYPRTRDASPAG
jgi:transcriptional regulator with XRE-family HTH domain